MRYAGQGQGKRVELKETVIRRMTRLAVEHGAVNLSQGFTDEAPVFDMVWGGVSAMLGGTQEGVDRIESMTLREILDAHMPGGAAGNSLDLTLKELAAGVRNPRDQLNQYSFPFGIPELRHAIADYTEALYGVRPDPEDQITVVLGASEGMAVAFRSLLEPGDEVVVMQPYHELYPSQAAIFGLVPRFVTLREDREAGTWRLDRDEVRAAVAAPSVRAFVVNSPQNPTGKVLDREELSFLAELCREHDLFAITDEIYEHITFDGHRHHYLAAFEGMADRTLVVNSISKTGRSTGWRIGWVITPPERTRLLRAVHDNLVVQAPTPLQKGAVALLRQERGFFDGIAESYRQKRDLLVEGLRSVGFTATPPEGAYYLFADYRSVPALAKRSPMDAAMHLVTEVGGGDGARRQLLRHRQRRGPLPAVRVLPFARDARGGSRTPSRKALSAFRVRLPHLCRICRAVRRGGSTPRNPVPDGARGIHPIREHSARSRAGISGCDDLLHGGPTFPRCNCREWEMRALDGPLAHRRSPPPWPRKGTPTTGFDPANET